MKNEKKLATLLLNFSNLRMGGGDSSPYKISVILSQNLIPISTTSTFQTALSWQ